MEEVEVVPEPPTLVSSNPPNGGGLLQNGTLTLTFTAAPVNVTVNGKPATVAGKTASLAGPHPGDGPTPFAIQWDNGPGGEAGIVIITLRVIVPDVTPPRVTKTNFTARDADPAPLNRDGVIIEFSEPIAKSTLKLTLEDGTNLGWLPEVKNNRGTLHPIKRKELANETTYIIQGAVEDAAGNRTNVKEFFGTKLKE